MPIALKLVILVLVMVAGCSALNPSDGNGSVYSPPFKQGRKFFVSQAFLGSKTHNNPLNYYAVDLVMPRGEPVCAARSGWVEEVHDNPQSTYVRIAERNDRLNDYQHLLPGSVSVVKGQYVTDGECFAKVGNSGISTGEHLHFAVLVIHGDQWVSAPFKFIHADGQSREPVYLQSIRH